MDPTDTRADSTAPSGTLDNYIAEQIGESAFFRALVENTSDGIVTIDEQSTIVFANPAIEQIFGYAPDELVGDSLMKLIPERLQERHTISFKQYLETGERNLNWDGVELPGLHKEGHEVELSISFREVKNNDQHLFTGIVRDITDRKQRERTLERYSQTLNAVGDGVYQLDLNGQFVAVNDVVTEVSGYPRDELIGENVSLLLDDEGIRKSAEVIQELVRNDDKDVGVVEFDVHPAEGSVVPVEDRIALLRSNGEVTGTVGVVRDISDRKQRERELERQRNELAELNRINAVIRDINQTLVGATTREEIEETVCQRLAGSDSYVFVWIGENKPGNRMLRPTRWAGVSEEYIQDITVTTDDQLTGHGPTGRAFRTGEIEVAQDITEEPEFEPWQDDAQAENFQSSAAIPIRYGDTIYGILNIYSDRPYAFDEREQNVLAELGETIGHAINAVESKKLLYSDTVVELEFRITSTESFFIDASNRLGCALQLEGVIPATDGTFLYYVSVIGASPESLVELVAEAPNIDDVTVVTEHDGESLLLFKVSGSSAVMTLIEAGARVKTARAEDGEAVFTADVALDTDANTIVDTVKRVFPESELVARREIERPVQTQRDFREIVKGRLTDKQRTALEAAYRGGYFARPRDISGNELAESFDVSPSTFHEHLQTALRKAVGAIFDE
jgi:PAS domain S-box-containing protein